MRTGFVVIALMMSFATLSCKKEQQEPKKEKPTAVKKTTDKTEAQAEAASNRMNEAVKGEGGVKESLAGEIAEGEMIDPNLTDPKKGELPADLCKDRIEEEERIIRRDFLPQMKAEQQALLQVEGWIAGTYKILESGDSEISKQRIEQFWSDYRDCVDGLEKPKVEPDPECVAYVTGNTKLCDGLAESGTRDECADMIRVKASQDFLLDWARSGFAKEFCWSTRDRVETAYSSYTMCALLSTVDSCDAESLDKGLLQFEVDMCEAAKAGAKGGTCGVQYPEGSPMCTVVKMMQAKDPVAKCKELSAAKRLPDPHPPCDSINQFASFNCDMIANLPERKADVKLPEAECRFVQAIKSPATTCDGLLTDDESNCAVLLAIKAELAGDKAICSQLKDERFAARCRTMFSKSVDDCVSGNSTDWGTNSVDDVPCRKLLWKKTVLPATAGRVEVRLTLANVFDSPAECSFVISVTSEGATSTKTEKVSFEGAMVKVVSVFFVTDANAAFDAVSTCTWDRKMVDLPESKDEKTPSK